jgi:hypothetical protein
VEAAGKPAKKQLERELSRRPRRRNLAPVI